MNIRQIHRANVLKNLEHRLAVAKEQGNIRLIEQLKAEKRYYQS